MIPSSPPESSDPPSDWVRKMIADRTREASTHVNALPQMRDQLVAQMRTDCKNFTLAVDAELTIGDGAIGIIVGHFPEGVFFLAVDTREMDPPATMAFKLTSEEPRPSKKAFREERIEVQIAYVEDRLVYRYGKTETASVLTISELVLKPILARVKLKPKENAREKGAGA